MNTHEQNTANALVKASDRLAKLGFKAGPKLGLNPLKIVEGDTVFITVTSEIREFEAKTGKTYEYVNVVDLESGEADMTFWLSGQIRHQFETIGDYKGKSFMITHKGQVNVDGQKVNQFDIAIINK